jgi:hypothetical protein
MRHFFLSVAALLANSAYAVPVTWTLQDVYLGGSLLTGSFVYDADAPDDACLDPYIGEFPDCPKSHSYPSQQYSEIYIELSQPLTSPDFTLELDINDGSANYNNWDYPPDYGVSHSGYLQLNGNHAYINGNNDYAVLKLSFAESLTNAGGVIQVTGSWNPDPYNIYGIYNAIPLSGSVVASVVPIPAAVWLFGSGLAALGWIRKRSHA